MLLRCLATWMSLLTTICAVILAESHKAVDILARARAINVSEDQGARRHRKTTEFANNHVVASIPLVHTVALRNAMARRPVCPVELPAK